MDSTDNLSEPTNGYHNSIEVPLGALDEYQQNIIGDCHILNFEEYNPEKMQCNKRDGSENDVTALEEVFSNLNFNVYKNYKNLCRKDTLKAVHDAAHKMKERPGKYLVCCIMTHGNKYDQLATFNDWLSLDRILDECSDIIGKNQIIFIIQACRSDKLKLEKLVVTESTDFGCEAKFYSDVLVARSTYPDTVSMRNNGTYFIQEVCHTLKHLRGNINLFEVLTVVNFRMAYFFKTCIKGKTGGQMPIFGSTLTSEILFDAINSRTEPDGESFLDWRLKVGGGKSPDLNHISNLKYGITSKSVNFFGIKIQHERSEDLNEAAARLSRVLKKPYQNHIKPVKVSKMGEVLKNIEKGAKETADCVFYLISGPSSYGSLCDTRGRKINQRNVIERFVENQNSHLVSKPKIFLFLMFESVLEPCLSVESKELGESWDGDDSCLIAQHADILLINIVVKSEINKDIYKPVNAMIEQLETSNDSQDFLSILTKVNCVLYKDKFLNNENNFSFYSTLTRKLVLPK